MHETWENWLNVVKSCIYFARQTHEIFQVMPYFIDFTIPGSFEIHWLRQYLVNVEYWEKKVCKNLKWL